MYIVSYRRKSLKGWACLVIVKRWRTIYDRINAYLATHQVGLVTWRIVNEEHIDELHALR